jgi:octaprenyl-diphosphate synthase
MSVIKKLYDYLISEVSAVNIELQKDLPIDVVILQDVFTHIFNAGGKRLRPLLTLAIGKMIRKDYNLSTIYLAAAVELIHTATLLHDDVIDNAAIRRNLETANNIWGNKTSILVGDNMFSKAFQLIVKSNKIMAFKELADASATISAAEVWQLQILHKLDTTIEEYIRLITDKTAVLFGAACAVGAITNDCDDAIVSYARDFGINFGICYQINDDWLDYTGDGGEIGKETFQDIREGKVTLPMILLLEKLKSDNKIDDIRYIENVYQGENLDQLRITDMIQNFDIHNDIKTFSKKYSDNALNAIKNLNCNDSTLKSLLIDLSSTTILE